MDQYADGIFFKRVNDKSKLIIKNTTKKLDFIMFSKDINEEKGGLA